MTSWHAHLQGFCQELVGNGFYTQLQLLYGALCSQLCSMKQIFTLRHHRSTLE